MKPSDVKVDGKRIGDMSSDEIRLNILVDLSIREWYDLTDMDLDLDAVKAYGVGLVTKLSPIYVMCLYEDSYLTLCAFLPERKDWKSLGAEQFMLKWLWEKIVSG